MKRDEMLAKLEDRHSKWDILVIGGGATGAGIAVDAAARGYSVLLLERHDFGKGTSSRSTKLVHGGVRYLQQGNVSLVMEALKERGILRENAPHLVHDLRFVVPNYDWWEAPFYGIGLKVYDMLAGKYGFGPSTMLSKEETVEAIPTIRTEGLRGGVQYYDGQFDDARLLIHLCQTAAKRGAVLLNYCEVTGLTKGADGFIDGAVAIDLESGREHEISARVVVNATGPFTDSIRKMDDQSVKNMISPSQGVHIVLDASFLPCESAIMVPHTKDGRVLFAIPWHDHALIGTTDTPLKEVVEEPEAFEEEIEFILETAEQYLHKKPQRSDIRSIFAGIRPLVKTEDTENTAALSRDHTIHIAHSGLMTICGGKWTTYRRMAEDAVNHAAMLGQLEERPCPTRNLRIHGHCEEAENLGDLWIYGSDAYPIRDLIRQQPDMMEKIHPDLPYTRAEVAWGVREEMARTLEDVLSRRTRALLLHAQGAIDAASGVANLMAKELGKDAEWVDKQVQSFCAMASRCLPNERGVS
ncbi:MAG: glycerol-3-phosphate dehydrogenase/oxidase [Candidatus Omnitrophica bacterium]|nr:glycerol-3-phosphate dehydrogenase/oxidase [Candidatus Omnitrophota bacterium]